MQTSSAASRPTSRRPPDPLVSFGDFANRAGLSAIQKAGFEAWVRMNLGTFNHRKQSEWEQHLASFRTYRR